MSSSNPLSNLEIVSKVDTWPYYAQSPEKYKKKMSEFYYFMIAPYPLPFGYMHTSFITAMSWPNCWSLNHEKRQLTLLSPPDFKSRTNDMHTTLRTAHEKGNIPALHYWADEKFPIYASGGEHVLDINGSGVDLFGIINFSVHMIAYTNTSSSGRKYWVPRRSRTKMTFPGMLDNTVGGSLRSGEKPIDCIVREAAEEASLPESYTRENVRSCGTLSYAMDKTDEGGEGCQFQVQYLYEMEVGEGMVLRPNDGEVEEFRLMGLEEVYHALRHGEFKLNCGMTWMAYLVRHGIVNAENEKDLVEICARMHRKHDLFNV